MKALVLIKASITSIPDYPKPGIIFRDITILVADHVAFQAVVYLIFEQ